MSSIIFVFLNDWWLVLVFEVVAVRYCSFFCHYVWIRFLYFDGSFKLGCLSEVTAVSIDGRLINVDFPWGQNGKLAVFWPLESASHILLLKIILEKGIFGIIFSNLAS